MVSGRASSLPASSVGDLAPGGCSGALLSASLLGKQHLCASGPRPRGLPHRQVSFSMKWLPDLPSLVYGWVLVLARVWQEALCTCPQAAASPVAGVA